MYLYSIMPLDTEHLDQICEDVANQYESGVSNCVLFKMTLVPEGNPVIDKAEVFCKEYDLFRDKLLDRGMECGILVQASIGHGGALDNEIPFKKYVNLTNGMEQNVCCPYDENLRDHFREVMKLLASHKPKIIMVDDDLRLMYRNGRGCACSMHLAEFNSRAGTDFTTEELYRSIKEESKNKVKYRDIFIQTQREASIGLAKAMREGIDSVDKTIQGAFCACGDDCEFAEEMAQVLCGEGNPSIVRINNGRYTPLGGHEFTYAMLRAAKQVNILKNKVDIILAETDTCPQNRYSTGAQFLHSHFMGTLLEGAVGAKHWITRFVSFEPDSGRAYRKILSKNIGLYEAVCEIVPKLKPVGCRIPISNKREFYFDKEGAYDIPYSYSWATHALERLGLPLYFSSEIGGATFMTGDADKGFSDEELMKMFEGVLFLASDSLKALNERGFLEYTGVKTEKWTGENITGEIISLNNNTCEKQKNALKLIPQNVDVKIDSIAYHLKDGKEIKPLFPATTVYKNKLGGTVISFCGIPRALFNYIEGFSFLNESRKLQLVNLLKITGCLPVYYTGDEDVYLRVGYYDDKLFCALFNLSFDIIDEISLCLDMDAKKIEIINSQGERVECEFRNENNKIIIKEKALPMNPVIIIISSR